MKSVVAHLAILIWLLLLVGLVSQAGAADGLKPPPESLAGLKPGDTVGEATNRYGTYSIILPGFTEFYAGGGRATHAYDWTIGATYSGRALSVETTIGSKTINVVMVDRFPTLATSRGLRVFMPEDAVRELYGMPDFAFEWTVFRPSVIELFYLDRGLIVVLSELPGQTNWTVTKLILTYPDYLSNAVAMRERQALATREIQDITRMYRVWARMAQPSS
ncbi:MAG: hypothetical protein ACYDCO_02255 [Armatimonadota bacterium]